MDDKQEALLPIREELVEFHGDDILVAVTEDDLGEELRYIAVRPVCEFIGVDWSAQRRRILRDPVLASEARSVAVTATEAGGRREMLCLPDRFLHGFLFGINASRAKSEIRDSLILYQRECYAALSRHFSRERRTETEMLEQIEAAMHAGAELARAQLYQGEEIDRAHARLDAARGFVLDLARRLAKAEHRIGLGKPLTEEQAADLQARWLETSGLIARVPGQGGRKNPYAGLQAALKRDFGVTSYKNIPMDRYNEAVAWIEGYYDMYLKVLEDGGVATGIPDRPGTESHDGIIHDDDTLP